jgi:quercetin dioxygenase-like cupin family protein
LLANADLDTRGRHRLPPTIMSTFPALSSLPSREILGGVIRGHYAHLAQLTIGEVNLDAGTDVPMHDHPHEQVTYVISGRFEFTVGNETTILEPGMAAMIPGGVRHGGRTLTACRVIDVFSPARDDYR